MFSSKNVLGVKRTQPKSLKPTFPISWPLHFATHPDFVAVVSQQSVVCSRLKLISIDWCPNILSQMVPDTCDSSAFRLLRSVTGLFNPFVSRSSISHFWVHLFQDRDVLSTRQYSLLSVGLKSVIFSNKSLVT